MWNVDGQIDTQMLHHDNSSSGPIQARRQVGVRAVGWPPPALKCHFFSDCLNANILNIVCLWNKINNRLDLPCRFELWPKRKTQRHQFIILTIKVSPRQPLGTPIFKPWKRSKIWGKRPLRYPAIGPDKLIKYPHICRFQQCKDHMWIQWFLNNYVENGAKYHQFYYCCLTENCIHPSDW